MGLSLLKSGSLIFCCLACCLTCCLACCLACCFAWECRTDLGATEKGESRITVAPIEHGLAGGATEKGENKINVAPMEHG